MVIVIIQPLLPKYDIDFLNEFQKTFPVLELLVVADIESNNSLNQFEAVKSTFKVQHLRLVEFLGFVFRPGLLRFLQNNSSSIIVFNGNPRDISQLFAMVLLWLLGRDFCVWGMFHRIGGPRLISSIYYKIVGKLARKCLCYSRTGATNLVSLGVCSSRIGIVGTAINERVPTAVRLSKSAAVLESFRKSAGLQGKHLVLQVVRLSRYKRPELLISAAELMGAKRKDIVFALIGGGEMLEELQQLVVAKGLGDFIQFLGPIYDELILADWYLSASAFVVPTCIGLSAHHAMAYGVPVITDDSLSGQASEFAIVSDGLNGLTYREGCAASLASTIERVIDDGILRARLSSNALATVNEIYTINAKVQNFSSLILEGSSK